VGESSKRRGSSLWSWLKGVPGGGKLNVVLGYDMVASSAEDGELREGC
jgi:hypothetical protein